MSTEYRPGVCNIGGPERRIRYGFGAVSFLIAAGIIGAVHVFELPQWVLLVTIVPLFGGFTGYYQGRRGFCVRFAFAGVYNTSTELGDQHEVEDQEAVREDRRQAKILLARAAITAVGLGIVLYLLLPV